VAVAKEAAKRVLRRQYIVEMAGRKVTAGRPLLGRHPRPQTFRAQAPGLSGIDVMIGTYGRLNSCDVILHLHNGLDGAVERAVVTVNALTLEDGDFCRFQFPALTDSGNREFSFWLESPDAVLGDCVTVFTDVDTHNIVFSPVYG
jgi:hypothetical protein